MPQSALFSYTLPLSRPVTMLGSERHERKGLLLSLSQDGCTGWGEAAPFAGLHSESLAQAEAELRAWMRSQARPSSPSARYALQMAQISLEAALQGVPLTSRLSTKSRGSVRVNALLTGSVRECLAQALALQQEGYTHFKLKVGRAALAQEAELVRTLRTLLGESAILRLDANRAWELEQAVAFGKMVRDCGIAWIEEPTRDSSQLPQFWQQTGIGYALDESLTPARQSELLAGRSRPAGLAALILRPNLRGGWLEPLEFTADTPALILSSAFESGLTIAMLACLAACLPEQAMGLDTYRWIAADLLHRRLSMQNGAIDVREAEFLLSQLDQDRLTKIA